MAVDPSQSYIYMLHSEYAYRRAPGKHSADKIMGHICREDEAEAE